MKVRSVHFWIAVLSFAAVVSVAVVDLQRTSPGELTRVHARDGELEGGQNCDACHGGFFSGMTESCLDCHAPIAQQFEQNEGLHGVIDREVAQRCSTCHSEHHGPQFAIVNRQSFALAGVPDPKQFDHELIGWEMNGKHLELDCAECHTHASVDVLPQGAVRFLGLVQDCASCHDDPHEGMMKVSCASCHGQESWDSMRADGHERFLPLIGGHGDLDCRACHAQGSERALEAMDKRGRPIDPRACLDCHASPHVEGFAESAASAQGIAHGAGCVGCHAAEHVSFRDPRLELDAAQHAWSGFSLDKPHDTVACEKCHDPQLPEFLARYPGREQDRCSQCHADPHGGQFQEGPFSQGDCIACHARTEFAPHLFGVDDHQRAAFALSGMHEQTACNACHLVPEGPNPLSAGPDAELPREFRGTPGVCELCHADVHDAIFAEPASVLPPLAAGECARCHDTSSFTAVPESRFDHGAWTNFTISGAHAEASCEVCHVPRAEPDVNGRSFGRVDEHFGKYTGCITCHADPHDGRFDGEQFPVEVDGKTDCARCHDTSSFRTLYQGFDHGRWTGFELRQGHARADCAACHTPRIPPDANGRSWEPALGSACADCHDNPHGGQFAVQGQTNCAACHDEDARNFSTFDHDRDSRFPLGETHRDVACAQCHLSEAPPGVQNGRPIVRYKPLGIECADCHGVHEEVLLRRRPGIK